MNTDKASNFINSLVRNLQVLCHSNVDFSDNVEVIGHIYLSVDKSKKFNYIVNEKVCKSDDSSTVFVSNSFHAEDQKKKEEKKSDKAAGAEQKSRPTGEQPRHHPHNQTQFHTSSKRNSNQSDNKNFSPIQRQKRPPHYETPHNSHGSDNKKPRHTPSDHSAHASPNKQIKQEPMSIDLTNVKEEPSENNEISNLSFADISDTSWSHSKHQQVSEQRLPGTDDNLPVSFGGDNDNYGIYPVAMYDSNLGSLTSQSTSSQDAIDQQFQGILPAYQGVNRRPRNDMSLEDKIKLIKFADDNNQTQSAIAEIFQVSQPTVSYILRRKKQYLSEYENQNKSLHP